MKAVILAGGLGTRLSEETSTRPKPMVEVGGKPILWHIMKIYSHYDINDFIICCGYKGYFIKEYFLNYRYHNSDLTIDLSSRDIEVHQNNVDSWKITLVDTGEHSMTGGRLKRVRDYIGDEDFCFTYGDGVSDVDIKRLVESHKKSEKLATVTLVQPPSRFGNFSISEEKIIGFVEKPVGEGNWINGGFFVLSPEVIDYVEDDQTVWEKEPLERLATTGQLNGYFHRGFWKPMDTLRDKISLEEAWNSNKAEWKKW